MRRLLLAAVTASVVAACGGGGTAGAVGVSTIRAAAAVSTTTSARMTEAVEGIPGSGGKPLVVDGVIDFAHRRAEMHLDAKQFGTSGRVTAVLDYVSGAVEYVEIPGLSNQVPGKSWVRADIGGGDVQFPDPADDPAGSVAVLRGAQSEDVVGHETLHGADTTHEHALIDLRRSAELAPPAQRPALERDLTRLRTTKLPIDVWIDHDGRVRRLRETIRQEDLRLPPQQAFATPLTYTTDLWDFGTPTDIRLPRAEQVIDSKDLAAQMQHPTS